ncbi:MAG: bifunctional alpha/beta hydrolase/OsmC family protein [Pseudomonadota bacterium]
MTERVSITSKAGHVLSGRLDQPKGKPKAWALFAHCFSCSKDIQAARRVARRLAHHGFGVLRFDFTGLGDSEGDFSDTSFSSNLDDLVAAADWLQNTHGAPQLLIGHSLGGAAVVAAASRIVGAKAVATIGAPSDASHVIHQFGDRIDEIEARGEASVDLAGRPFTIKREFLEDVRGSRVKDAARDLNRPLLVLHSPIDGVVGIDNATGLFLAAKHPKSFVSLDDADHLLSRGADADYAADVIAGWAGRYLSDTPSHGATPTADLSGAVVVEETGAGLFQNHMTVRGFEAIADEPPRYGGGDTGPTPYDFLTMALGACTSITMRMYAERKGWSVDKIAIRLTHGKDHAEDCANCEEGQKVDIFEKEIRIEGPLDDAQRQRLFEIADRCPVHRTLNSPVVIRSRMV